MLHPRCSVVCLTQLGRCQFLCSLDSEQLSSAPGTFAESVGRTSSSAMKVSVPCADLSPMLAGDKERPRRRVIERRRRRHRGVTRSAAGVWAPRGKAGDGQFLIHDYLRRSNVDRCILSIMRSPPSPCWPVRSFEAGEGSCMRLAIEQYSKRRSCCPGQTAYYLDHPSMIYETWRRPVKARRRGERTSSRIDTEGSRKMRERERERIASNPCGPSLGPIFFVHCQTRPFDTVAHEADISRSLRSPPGVVGPGLVKWTLSPLSRGRCTAAEQDRIVVQISTDHMSNRGMTVRDGIGQFDRLTTENIYSAPASRTHSDGTPGRPRVGRRIRAAVGDARTSLNLVSKETPHSSGGRLVPAHISEDMDRSAPIYR